MKTNLLQLAVRVLLAKAIAPAMLLVTGEEAHATSATWKSTSTNATWSTTTNWTPAAAPGSADTATFNSASNNTTISLGSGVTVKSILFDTANAAAFTIGSGTVGSQTLTLSAAGSVTRNATVTNDELFNANTILAGTTYTFTNSGTTGGLTFAGNIAGSSTSTTTALTLAGAGLSNIVGVLSDGTTGVLSVTASGAGTWMLGGLNSFSGPLTVSNGAVSVAALNEVATNGPLGIGANPITLGGSLGTTGVLEYTGGSVSSGRTFSMAANGAGGFQIDAADSTVALSVTNALTGTGELVKSGPGTLEVAGMNSAYGGVVQVAGGTLAIDLSTSLGSGPNGVGPQLIMNGGTFSWLAISAINFEKATIDDVPGNVISVATGLGISTLQGSGTVTKAGAGTLSFGTATMFTGIVIVSGGAVSVSPSATPSSAAFRIAAGAKLLNGAFGTNYTISLGSLAGAGLVGNTFTSSGTATLSIGGNGADTTFSGTIENSADGSNAARFALTKIGAGSLTLSGSNTYSGPTEVAGGELVISGALGLTSTSGITVDAGATLGLQGTGDLDRIADAVPITLQGATLSTAGASGLIESLGEVLFNGHSTLDFGSGSGDWLTLDGIGIGTLQILNWTGVPDTAGNASDDRLILLGTSSIFNVSFPQNTVSFNGVSGYETIQIDSNHYEVVSNAPEPSSQLLLLLGAAGSLGGLRLRKHAGR